MRAIANSTHAPPAVASSRSVTFSALLQPLIDDIADRQAPSQYSNWNRAVAGTWLLVAGVYGAHDVMVRYNLGLPDLVTAVAGHRHGPTSALAAPIIGFIIAVLGGLWVVKGVLWERSPHQAAGVLWLCLLIGGCTYALVGGVYVDDAPVANSYLQGFYLATLAASVMELFLFMRCARESPLHYPVRDCWDDVAARSYAGALRRARLARVAQRANSGVGGGRQPTNR